MNLFRRHCNNQTHESLNGPTAAEARVSITWKLPSVLQPPPPKWTITDEPSRADGIYSDASEEEYQWAERFCETFPPDKPVLLPSIDVDRINHEGCKAWSLEVPDQKLVGPFRFKGRITDLVSGKEGGPKVVKVETERGCGDVCLMSNYPVIGGLYSTQRKRGVYFEVTIVRMEGVIAIGLACKPYPQYRLPGWNRLSAALHLDDFQKFASDPNGGRHYDSMFDDRTIRPGDVIGCGYEFSTGTLFYTFNGARLSDAFRYLFWPRENHDVFAAIGVSGEGANEAIVNFGGDVDKYLFRWMPGREWDWQVQGHVGVLSPIASSSSTSAGGGGDELPTYEESRLYQ